MDLISIFNLLGIATIISIFLFLNPKTATYVLIFLCIFDLGFFSRWFEVTRYFARLPFLLAILLSLNLGIDCLVGRFVLAENERTIRIILKFIGFLLLTAVISITYNHESIILGLYDLRYYFLLFALCLTIYHYKPLSFTQEGFIKFLIAIGLIQIPFTIIQYFFITFGDVPLDFYSLDMSSGTFSSYPPLVFFQLVAIGFVLTYQLKKKTPILKINNYILIFLLLIPLLLSYSRSAMGFVIILCLIIIFRQLFYVKSFSLFFRTVTSLVFIPVILFFSFYQFFWKQHFDIQKQLNPTYLKEYFFRYSERSIEARIQKSDPVMGRFRAVLESINQISTSPMKFLFGLGSGSTSEASLLGAKGRYYQRYGPLSGLGRTQISKTIAELGLVGLTVLLTFFMALLREVRELKRFDEGQLAIDLYIVILLSIVMLAFYSTIFESYIIIFVLAYFIAFIQAHLNRKKTVHSSG